MGWAKLILAGSRLWLDVRPFRRWKERRQAKRAARRTEAEAASTEGSFQYDDEEDSGMNADQIASIGRTLLKVLGGTIASAAVTHGVIDATEVDTLTTAIVTGGGALMTIAGIWLSHRKHKV